MVRYKSDDYLRREGEPVLFCCPVCGGAFRREGGSLLCPAGHCFDYAKHGYVNLLRSNASSAKRHGDDRAMLLARRDFLDRGHYRPILEALLELALPLLKTGDRVLDLGCGEGWYARGLLDAAAGEGKALSLAGVDISKEALRLAAKRLPEADLAVASAARLPLPEGGCELLLNLFSPLEPAEFRQVLSPEGRLLRAVVLPGHLLELKQAVYDRAYDNPEPATALEGFHLAAERRVLAPLELKGEEIGWLFTMTPYYYKTSPADLAKLETLRRLETRLAVALLLYERA